MIPKILVVEDSLTARQFVREALQRFHCELLEAEDAPAGLAAAHRAVPDLVLLDVGLDGMDGSEMLARLRVDPALKKVPVIVFTSQATRASVLKMARLGVRDYLLKPLKEEVFCARVGRVVNLVPKDSPPPVARRFEDRLRLLIIDDKPAVQKVLAEGLESTGWELLFRNTLAEGMESWKAEAIDAVLISTSLAGGSTQEFASKLKCAQEARRVPLIALVPASPAEPELGWGSLQDYDGICEKPVDCEELKDLLARVLKLDRISKFFEVVQSVLFIRSPSGKELILGEEVLKLTPHKLRDAIDGGVTKVAIDLLHIKKAEPKLLRVVVGIIGLCQRIGLETAVLASENVVTQCSRYEEAQQWTFYNTREAILAAWTEPVPAGT